MNRFFRTSLCCFVLSNKSETSSLTFLIKTGKLQRKDGWYFILPADYSGKSKLPAIVIVGVQSTVKEQMAGLYGRKLTEKWFAALAFDYRHFEESGGEPRFYDSTEKHITDISSEFAYSNAIKSKVLFKHHLLNRWT